MRRFAMEGKKTPAIREAAFFLTRNLKQKDYESEAYELGAFVRDGIRYTKDVTNVETLQTPIKTLEYKAGDCDDKVTLLSALLESIGHPTRFVAMGFSPDRFSHVYLETKIKNEWIPIETTEPVEMGWEPNGVSFLRFPAEKEAKMNQKYMGTLPVDLMPTNVFRIDPNTGDVYQWFESEQLGEMGGLWKKIEKAVGKPLKKAWTGVEKVGKAVLPVAAPVAGAFFGPAGIAIGGAIGQMVGGGAPVQGQVIMPESGYPVAVPPIGQSSFQQPYMNFQQPQMTRYPNQSPIKEYLPWILGGTAGVLMLVLLLDRR